MKKYKFLLVNADSLPEVFSKVVYAKELLSNAKAANVSDAVRKAGISRSAFYKYRNEVFTLDHENRSQILDLEITLADRAGVFSAFTEKLYRKNVNILTINQHHPVDGKAKVLLSVRIDDSSLSVQELLNDIKKPTVFWH